MIWSDYLKSSQKVGIQILWWDIHRWSCNYLVAAISVLSSLATTVFNNFVYNGVLQSKKCALFALLRRRGGRVLGSVSGEICQKHCVAAQEYSSLRLRGLPHEHRHFSWKLSAANTITRPPLPSS